LRDQLEPFGREVVALVQHHRLVLAAGDLLAVHTAYDVVHHFVKQARAWLGYGLPVGDQLVAAPFMKMPYLHSPAQALGLHDAVQLHAQRFVKAEDEDGLAERCAGLRQILGAVTQDHGFAGAGHAVDDAVAVAQAAGQLLLLEVHHAHDVG
jgi:hypothetical protein